MMRRYFNILCLFSFMVGAGLLFQNCGEFSSMSIVDAELGSVEFEFLDAGGCLKTKIMPTEFYENSYIVEDDMAFDKNTMDKNGKIILNHALTDSIIPRPEYSKNKMLSSIKVRGEGSKWPGGVIRYVILKNKTDGDLGSSDQQSFTESEYELIKKYIKEFNELMQKELNGDVKLVEISMAEAAQKKHLRIYRSQKIGVNGFASVGYKVNKPYIAMVKINQTTFFHETMHVLGFMHEHQRSDRDKYLSIDWNKLNLGSTYQSLDRRGQVEYGNFDLDSIMLYAYARLRNSNLLSKKNETLSQGDICGLKEAYSSGCSALDSVDDSGEALPDIANMKLFDVWYSLSDEDKKQYTINPSVDTVSINGKVQTFVTVYNQKKGDNYSLHYFINDRQFYVFYATAKFDASVNYLYINENISELNTKGDLKNETGLLRIELTYSNKTLVKTAQLVDAVSQMNSVELRYQNKTLVDIVEHMCSTQQNTEQCFAYNYDVINSRIKSVTLEGGTYTINGLYDAWKLTLTQDQHLKNNLLIKELTAPKLSAVMHTCERNVFRGDMELPNLNAFIYAGDNYCIDYTARKIDDQLGTVNIDTVGEIERDIVAPQMQNPVVAANTTTPLPASVTPSAPTPTPSAPVVMAVPPVADSDSKRVICRRGSLSDPDGDGIGWENCERCIVDSE